jgi:hypothetical protein
MMTAMPFRQACVVALSIAALLAADHAFAQTSYRLKGTLKDEKGAAVAGGRVHAEALQGFRGEQFVGQKEFVVTSNDKGEWNILGLTAGMWAFEATAPGYVPQVIVLPVNFTQRKMQSATGGQLSWDLPIVLPRTENKLLQAAAEAAMAGRADEATSLAGGVASESDGETVCYGGHVAMLVRQHGLAQALFRQVLARVPKHPCATLGLSSSLMMQNDLITAGKHLWDARDVVPQNQRRALAAAISDLQQMMGIK